MIFKTFNVDFDKVTIDDAIIDKPKYLTTSQWLDFWSFSEEANSGQSIKDKIDEEVDAIIRSNEQEYEEELKREVMLLKSEFNKNIDDILAVVEHSLESAKFYAD